MSDPESLYQEAQEYKYEQRMADKNHVFPCEQCYKMTYESELESVNNEEICKKCRGNLSECCGAEVRYLATGNIILEDYPGRCTKCEKVQIYSKSGWQNYE